MSKLLYFVDDDKMILHLLEYTLAGQDDYEIRSFRRGEDCLAALDNNPDLIVLDHSYIANDSQYLTGLEILREIRKHTNKVEVIVLTADKNESLKDEYSQLGVNQFILKDSYFIDTLIETINKYFSVH
jgi:DNA-binding NarL/FixJ family response regulator